MASFIWFARVRLGIYPLDRQHYSILNYDVIRSQVYIYPFRVLRNNHIDIFLQELFQRKAITEVLQNMQSDLNAVEFIVFYMACECHNFYRVFFYRDDQPSQSSPGAGIIPPAREMSILIDITDLDDISFPYDGYFRQFFWHGHEADGKFICQD